MNRLEILNLMSKNAKTALNFWISGILVVLIGVILYFVEPLIVSSSYNVSGEADFNSGLSNKQVLATVLIYISYALMIIGTILAIIVGEIFAGYAAFEADRLKNYDKEKIYYDYSTLSILSCFLLPFIFLYYLRLQVEKEIKYLKRNSNDYLLNLVSEAEWNNMDLTARTEYLSYLLQNNAINEQEFKFLLRQAKLGQEKDSHMQYKNSEELEKSIFEDEKKSKFRKIKEIFSSPEKEEDEEDTEENDADDYE